MGTYNLVFTQNGTHSSPPGQLRGSSATAQPVPQPGSENPASSTRRSAGAVAGIAALGFLLGFPTVSQAGPETANTNRQSAGGAVSKAPSKAERLAKQKAKLEEEAAKYKMNDQGSLKKVVNDDGTPKE